MCEEWVRERERQRQTDWLSVALWLLGPNDAFSEKPKHPASRRGPHWFQSFPRAAQRWHMGTIVCNILWLRQGCCYHIGRATFPYIQLSIDRILLKNKSVSTMSVSHKWQACFTETLSGVHSPLELETQKHLLLILCGDLLACRWL